MTEAEWLTCSDPSDMLTSFPAKWDARKLDLFGCACLRRVWHLLTDPRSRACVEAAERQADVQAPTQDVAEAWASFLAAAEQDELADFSGFDAYEALRNLVCFTDPAASLCVASAVAEGVGAAAAALIPLTPPEEWCDARTEAWRKAEWQERSEQANLLRCIIGNPFRSVSCDPSWLTPAVRSLARVIYDERSFEDLAILADALEDAGCDNAGILIHCRGPGPHGRGCWVVDLILGRA